MSAYVQVQEVEQAKEAAHERAEAENAERQRIEEIIAEAQVRWDLLITMHLYSLTTM